MNPVDLFDKGSSWTKQKIEGAKDQLDAQTPCEEWKVRDVIGHVTAGQEYFQKSARGEEASFDVFQPSGKVAGDPAAAYEEARQATLEAFRGADPEQNAMTIGIAFVDQVIHGTDIAKATGQDATIPADLAEAAFGMINGNLPPERRGDAFGPEIEVPDDAPVQDKLLAYMGRKP